MDYKYSLHINDNKSATLPAIHSFERYKPLEYQPVRGVVNIVTKGENDKDDNID